jgi:hypothetical protein
MKTVVLSLPMFGFVVGTRAALGAGIGLLLSKKIPESRRKAIGLTLVTIGAATTVPALMAIRRRLNERAPARVPPDRDNQTAEVPIKGRTVSS